jgi:glycosyltransferase involved in cell wall biosynthesis
MDSAVADDLPLASVCISNHNYERYLCEAIDSVLAQDYPHVEVIVVDDASSDGSRPLIENYGDRIRTHFNETNLGQNAALSTAVAMARGELILLLDADDVFYPGKVSRMVDLYRRHPDASVLMHRLPNGNADLSRIGPGKPFRRQGYLREQMIGTNGFCDFQPTSSMAFPRHVLERVMPLPPSKSGGESDFVLALLTPLFGEMVACDEALGARRLHGENIYSHADRLAHREWTLRDNIARTRDGIEIANAVLARIGEDIVYDPDGYPWIIEMRHQLGEISSLELIRARLRLLRPWFGTYRALRDVYFTLQRSGTIRRRIERRRRRGKAT